MSTRLTDELQRHSAALRAIARSLVGGDDADDLVQTAAVSALQVRGPVQQPAALLRRILERLAGRHRRSERRRLAREAAVPPPDAPPGPEWLVAQRETVQRLHEALFALPEPCLGVLLLRYFEGLTPTAIAARLEIPLPTVKSRLQRGLGLLRERLATTAPDHDWRAGLCVAFGLPRTTAPAIAATTTGGMLMTVGTKWLVGGLGAALLVVSAWVALRDPTPTTMPTANAAAPVATTADTGAPIGAPTPPPDDRRTAAPTSEPALPAATRICGRCVDEAGRPLAGCRVTLSGSHPGREVLANWVRHHHDFEWQDPAPVTTGADGSFEWTVVPHEPLSFALSAHVDGRVEAGCRWPSRLTGPGLPPGAEVALGDVVLVPGARLAGRITDPTGAPVSESVHVHVAIAPAAEAIPHPRTDWWFRSDANGHFEPDWAIPSGPCRIGFSSRHLLDGSRALDQVLPIGRTWLEIVVAAPAPTPAIPRIRGIVVDELGRGVRAFVVGATDPRTGPPPRDESAEDGTFALAQTRAGQVLDSITVVDDAHQDGAHLDGPIAWGTDDVRLVVRRGVDVELRVTDAGGGAVEEFAAWCVYAGPRKTLGGLVSDSVPDTFGHHAGGRARLGELRRGPHTLFVEPRQPDLESSSLLAIEITGGEPQRFDVVLPRRAERTVRLVDLGDRPIVGALVELVEVAVADRQPPQLCRPIESFFAIPEPGFGGLIRQGATTDARGEVLLHGPAGRTYAIRAPGPKNVATSLGNVSLDVAEPLVFRVARGAALHVRLTPPGIVPVLQAYGAAFGRENPPTLQLRADATSVGLPGGTPLRDDGTASIAGIAPGRWHVFGQFLLALSRDHGANQDRLLGTVELRDGEATEVTFDLSNLRPGTLSATVLRDGSAWADHNVTLRVEPADPVHPGRFQELAMRTDAAGRVTARLLPGTYTLVQPFPADETWVVPPATDVEAVFTIRTGRLRLTLRTRDGTAAAGGTVLLTPRRGGDALSQTTTAAGTVDLEVPTGILDLQWEPHHEPTAPPVRVSLGDVTIAPGQHLEIERVAPSLAR